MSFVSDLVGSAVASVLQEILAKTTGTRKRGKRRRKALSATERLSRIEKPLRPAKRQTSRKKTVRARSKTRRRAP